ncbi:DUF1707 and DUF4190 domain-containing protein [Streptomyces sp. JJ66]|nr:DUF1707 and DUF4190 domain-containing protein [Streptomyces sp. JJ66]
MRASDADRERAADVLKAAFAEGRLRKDEYDARLTRVHQAATYADIQPLVADLPQGPVPMPAPAPQPVPYVRPVQPGYWTVPAPTVPRPTSGAAVAALVFAVLTPLTWGLFALPAVVTGHIARSDIRSHGKQGDGYATAGLVLGYLGVGLWTLVILVGIAS